MLQEAMGRAHRIWITSYDFKRPVNLVHLMHRRQVFSFADMARLVFRNP